MELEAEFTVESILVMKRSIKYMCWLYVWRDMYEFVIDDDSRLNKELLYNVNELITEIEIIMGHFTTYYQSHPVLKTMGLESRTRYKDEAVDVGHIRDPVNLEAALEHFADLIDVLCRYKTVLRTGQLPYYLQNDEQIEFVQNEIRKIIDAVDEYMRTGPVFRAEISEDLREIGVHTK